MVERERRRQRGRSSFAQRSECMVFVNLLSASVRKYISKWITFCNFLPHPQPRPKPTVYSPHTQPDPHPKPIIHTQSPQAPLQKNMIHFPIAIFVREVTARFCLSQTILVSVCVSGSPTQRIKNRRCHFAS